MRSARAYDSDGYVLVPDPAVDPKAVKAVAIAGGWTGAAEYTAQYTYDSDCGSGGGGEPTCWRYVDINSGISGLAVSDVFQPNTICLSWHSEASSFVVKRQPWSVPLQSWDNPQLSSLYTGHENNYCDGSGLVPSSKLAYAVRVAEGEEDPPTGYLECWHEPDDPDCHPILVKQWDDSNWAVISVTPERVAASEACAVDSRLDPREATAKPLDHSFAGSTYRGGLFVGLPGETDGSGAARSFLKFDMSEAEIGENEALWAASVNTFYTGSLSQTEETTTGCQVLGDDDWDASSLRWSNAPAMNPASASDTAVVGGQALAAGAWCHWSTSGRPILDEMFGDGILSVGLASTETANPPCGWAYFAKEEYDATRPPQILYAYGSEFASGGGGAFAPCFPIGLTLDAATVVGGLTVGGTVYLNTEAPIGGRSVQFSTSVPCDAIAPAVQVPAGLNSARFVVSTAIVDDDTEATVSAVTSAPGCTAAFTIDDGEN